MRQICEYAHPTARINPLIAQIRYRLDRCAKKNARPSTYSRLVPQSPNSRAAACLQPTFRGRSLAKRDNAAGLVVPRSATADSIGDFDPGADDPRIAVVLAAAVRSVIQFARRAPQASE